MKRTLPLATALLLALGACATPTPFDPGTDCPKEAYCGQCASRGACAWCGDPGESGKGQCVAVGHAKCAAPSAWSKTPDRCPLPPIESSASAAPATTSAGESSKEEAVRRALARAFP